MLSISKEQLAELPLAEYDGRSIVISSLLDCRKAVRYLSRQPLLGFDTETRPSFRKGHLNKVALLQISTADECFLFRLNRIGFPKELIALFENDKITKVGLSIKDDLHQLGTLANFKPENIIELQSFVKGYDIADNSLQKVYAIIFSKRMSKGQRLTNWEAETLTEAQQCYASLDAYACLQIYNRLFSGTFNPSASPYQMHENELFPKGHYDILNEPDQYAKSHAQ